MSLANIIAEVVKVAKAVAPFIPGGSAGVAAVEAVTGLIDNVKHFNSTAEEQAQLDAARAEFEATVNRHVDEAIAALRGNG